MTRNKRIARNVALYAALTAVLLFMLYPILLILNISLKTYQEYLVSPLSVARGLRFDNYKLVWRDMKVLSRALTTLWTTAAALILNTVISLLAAFPLSRAHFKGSGKVYLYSLASMFFPGSLVATIILLRDALFVYGSPPALILMWGTGSLQLNIFMLYNFIKSLPRDLDDAAFIDGCGYFRYIFTIAMPLMLPIVTTLMLLKTIGCWNDFLSPYIYVLDPDFRTLSTGLYLFMGERATEWNVYAAAIFTVAAPMIALYIFTQRFVISGMVSGALKG
ncbi:MAG: carbohydrate ABC transporter permease [Clostridiales bacterium]|jgi:raffinose/stachyose/melibiose transport system permease protein|nr:carbohydrate ABC transporter permease [Clostridiales bacterium]